MSKTGRISPSDTLQPIANRPAFLGTPPLVEGDDPNHYNELCEKLYRSVKPSDVLEQIILQEIADLTWEILRMRRQKARLLKLNAYLGLQNVLAPILTGRFKPHPSDQLAPFAPVLEPNAWAEAQALARAWGANDKTALKEVSQILLSAGLTMDDVFLKSFTANIDTIEQIDRMIISAEARRNADLREIERHRSALAERLRQATDNVEDAEFEIVEPRAHDSKTAA